MADDITARMKAITEHTEAGIRRSDAILAEIEAQQQAEKAERERDRRDQAIVDAETRRALQVRFDDVFQSYGEQCPTPVADQAPHVYHKRLLHTVQRRLSPSDERMLKSGGRDAATIADIARIPIDELTRSTRNMLDPLFEQAARVQAKAPHVSTLPAEGFVERYSDDPATGGKATTFYGKRSFIADINRPCRRVVGFRVSDDVLLNSSGIPIRPLEWRR